MIAAIKVTPKEDLSEAFMHAANKTQNQQWTHR